HFLVHQATLAVKEGLDRDTALRSITANPAQIMGLDDRVGSLRAGLDGDVVLWSGDPLDVMSRAMRVFVVGGWGAGFLTRVGGGRPAPRPGLAASGRAQQPPQPQPQPQPFIPLTSPRRG